MENLFVSVQQILEVKDPVVRLRIAQEVCYQKYKALERAKKEHSIALNIEEYIKMNLTHEELKTLKTTRKEAANG